MANTTNTSNDVFFSDEARCKNCSYYNTESSSCKKIEEYDDKYNHKPADEPIWSVIQSETAKLMCRL